MSRGGERRSSDFLSVLAGAVLLIGGGASAALLVLGPAFAKVPGEVHCYGGVCHRVKTLAETHTLVGRVIDVTSSYYDDPARDRHTPNSITSSGEAFDASSPFSAASAHFPDGTELLVWNPRTGLASHLRVNDFGPFAGARTLDVTRRVAEDLGFHKFGAAALRVRVIAAPTAEETRYKAYRRYPPVRGLIGRLSQEAFLTVGPDLIALAPAHRALPPAVALADGTDGAPPTASKHGAVPSIGLAISTAEHLATLVAAADPATFAQVSGRPPEPVPVPAALPATTSADTEQEGVGAQDLQPDQPMAHGEARPSPPFAIAAETAPPTRDAPPTMAHAQLAALVLPPSTPFVPASPPAEAAQPLPAIAGDDEGTAAVQALPVVFAARSRGGDVASGSMYGPAVSPEAMMIMLALALTTLLMVRRPRAPAPVAQRSAQPPTKTQRGIATHRYPAQPPGEVGQILLRAASQSTGPPEGDRLPQPVSVGGVEPFPTGWPVPVSVATAAHPEPAAGTPPCLPLTPPPPLPDARADASVITADFEITGSVSTSRDLCIAGRINGDVSCRDALVETGGVIEGRLIAATAAIEGWVRGGIEAGHVHLRNGCIVDGDITADTLQVDDGAQFEGRVLRRTPRS